MYVCVCVDFNVIFFQILLSVGFVWIVCSYLTFKNRLSPTDPANTDSKFGIFYNAQMFRLPYPCNITILIIILFNKRLITAIDK